jgi:peroxiredoxin
MRRVVALNAPRILMGLVLGSLLTAYTGVIGAPLNDHFANTVLLSGDTNFVTGSNAGATSQLGERWHADAFGSNSVWWSWQAPFTGSVSISTVGSPFDTLLAVYTGTSISNLQVVADNDDAGGFAEIYSRVVFRALAGETYHIAVDGFSGATGSIKLALGPTGYPAPSWALIDLNGQQVNATDFSNQVLVVDFWETTCGACIDELPYLKQLHYNFSGAGFTFFAVSMDPPSVNLQSFVQAHQIPYLVARGDEAIDDAFGGNVPFPTKFVIDRENKIVGQYSLGGVDYTYYSKIIKPLLRSANNVRLEASRENDALIFSWPATEFGYRLESKGALGGSSWSAVSNSVITTNSRHTVSLPLSAGAQFFRLQKTLPR